MTREPLTPEQAIANQLAYIAEERERMTALLQAFRTYAAAAKALRLHALTPDEINARFRQLSDMEREARSPEYAAHQIQISKWQAEA
jgi:hypothetical protein